MQIIKEMKPYHRLTNDEKLPWENKARCILYPDLRGSEENSKVFTLMLNKMASALYDCHRFQSRITLINVEVESIIDNPESQHWKVTKVK